MNLILSPLENPNDPVWSVIISILILLFGVGYYIRYIMIMAFTELEDDTDQSEGCGSGSTDSTLDTQD